MDAYIALASTEVAADWPQEQRAALRDDADLVEYSLIHETTEAGYTIAEQHALLQQYRDRTIIAQVQGPADAGQWYIATTPANTDPQWRTLAQWREAAR